MNSTTQPQKAKLQFILLGFRILIEII